MLSREDIGREPAKLIFEETKEDGITVIRHDLFTAGIGYLKVLFNVNRVPMEDVPYVALLKSVLGYVDTEKHTFSDLSNEIFLNTGGIGFALTTYPDVRTNGFTSVFSANVRVLYEKLETGFEILSEIFKETKMDDEKRLREILNEVKSKGQMKLMGSGHTIAVARATSYFSDSSYFNDLTGGLAYFQCVEGWVRDFDIKKDEIIAGLLTEK